MDEHDANRVLVVVVDDQLDGISGRRNVYKKWFDQVKQLYEGKWSFDVRLCGTIDEVAKVSLAPGQVCLAVLDMVLEGPEWTSGCVGRLDEKIVKEGWPLLLLSARFDSKEAIERANRLVGSRSAIVPFQFLPWSSICRAVEGIEWKEVGFIVDVVISQASKQDLRFSKSPSDGIEFLHITDPHFGKAKWDTGSLISLRMLRKGLGFGAADFLAITGDISNVSTPAQYELASSYCSALANNGLIAAVDTGLARDRVFVCPGNHDFSRALALSANVEGSKEFVVSSVVQPNSEWMRKYAWRAYYDFEFKTANASTEWIVNPGFRLNLRFQSFGIIVLELNVERFNIDGYYEGLSEDHLRDSINSAIGAVSGARRGRECLVVLAHRYESNAWSGLSQLIKSNLSGLASEGPTIFLCGHEHAGNVYADLKDRVLFVRGVPPVEGVSLPSKTLPTINFVRLCRKNGAVCGVEVSQYHQHADGWKSDPEGPTMYDYVNSKWRAV